MRKHIVILTMLFSLVLILNASVFASEQTVINTSDSKITVNGEEISSSTSSAVYLTNKTNNGGTTNKAIESNISIDNVININAPGTYEISGLLSNGQISINANNINGNVNLILNNLTITCKEAPAIFVYSKDVENENCKVTITSKQNTINNITGARIKQSVQDWENQSELLYYIDKGNDDDGSYYERYKYDGAISSDISLTFDGKGTLNINSSKKEGIESKMNVTINDGTYNINSLDDGINACADGKSKIEINGGKVVVRINLTEAEEGDGIDSNGSLEINGGTVYAFAYPGSDNGLDADLGVTINGGTVLSTGSMYERFEAGNDTNLVQVNLSNGVNSGETILVVDENEKVVFAYKTDRKLNTFAYSSENLTDSNYTIYTGTDITGTVDENGVYTEILNLDLTKFTKQENNSSNRGFERDFNSNNSLLPNTTMAKVILVILIILTIFTILIFVIDIRISKRK